MTAAMWLRTVQTAVLVVTAGLVSWHTMEAAELRSP